MDVRFYPPPTQPPSAADPSCLGPSRRFDSVFCSKFEGENMYMSMSEGVQDFAQASQLYPVPSLGDEDFNIPPITPPTFPEHMLHQQPQSESGPYHSQCPPISQNGLNGLHPFQPHNMDLPGITISSMLSQDGGAPPSFLSAMLHKANSDSSRCSGHPQMDDFRPSIQSVMMQQNHLTTINQSQLSTHLGLSRNSVPHSSPSPPGSKRASPSPSSSVPEEDPDEAQKVGGAEKRQAVDAGKKPKPQKKKKKKDPNEPQKPVSAYALFFRDTQAAIKGQNPSATFGEVSKIVASTWDGLGEEQKQLYKRKTEIAKKEYLKQLAAYRASLVSQSYSEPGEITGAQMTGSKPVGFPGVGVGQGQGGAYPGHAHQHQQAQHQASVSPLLHPSLTRGLSMPVPLSGANMAAASPPPPHPAMHQHASLQHQHQPVAMQKPLGNQHQHQLPLHSQPMPQGFSPQAEFHSMLNGMGPVGHTLTPPMDYITPGCRNPSAQSVDWSVDYCNNGTLQRERPLYLS